MKKHKNTNKNREAFTLIEILLVVAAISILASIVIVAINPAKQLAETRNAQRRADVNTILNATWQYAIDNDGSLPSGLTNSAQEICKTGGTCGSLLDLGVLVDTYIVSIPRDPQCPSDDCDAEGTGYTILETSGGRVTVDSPGAEESETINVTR